MWHSYPSPYLIYQLLLYSQFTINSIKFSCFRFSWLLASHLLVRSTVIFINIAENQSCLFFSCDNFSTTIVPGNVCRVVTICSFTLTCKVITLIYCSGTWTIDCGWNYWYCWNIIKLCKNQKETRRLLRCTLRLPARKLAQVGLLSKS